MYITALFRAVAAVDGGNDTLLLLRLYRKSDVLPVAWRMKWNGGVARRVLHIAYPAALERAAINLGQMMFARMASGLGVAVFAAHNQAIQVESIGYMPAYGFSAAATTLVGQRLGAGKAQEAREGGGRTIGLCLALLCVTGALMFIFAPFLISLLTPDGEVRRIGTMLILICAFEQPFNAVSIVASGALRGAGDTRVPFIYGLMTI